MPSPPAPVGGAAYRPAMGVEHRRAGWSADLDRAETVARLGGAVLALVGMFIAAPGIIASAGAVRGAVEGHPERILRPDRLAAITVGWFVALIVSWRPIPFRPRGTARAMCIVGGGTAVWAGLGLAIAGRLALGGAYRVSTTAGAALAPGQPLITSGPFSIVRHPMYLGLNLAALGSLLLYRTWATTALVVMTPVLVVRARREDALLERVFGDRWRRYAARVPAWLPRSPRR